MSWIGKEWVKFVNIGSALGQRGITLGNFLNCCVVPKTKHKTD